MSKANNELIIEALGHRRRLYVSGTGAEGADKRRDVDGVEEVRRVGMSPSQPTTGSRERRKLPNWPGEFMEFLAS